MIITWVTQGNNYYHKYLQSFRHCLWCTNMHFGNMKQQNRTKTSLSFPFLGSKFCLSSPVYYLVLKLTSWASKSCLCSIQHDCVCHDSFCIASCTNSYMHCIFTIPDISSVPSQSGRHHHYSSNLSSISLP